MIPSAGRVVAALLLALLVGACDAIAPPSASPTPSDDEPVVLLPPTRADAVACLNINPGECAFVLQGILPQLPGAEGQPFAVQIRLSRCLNQEDVCPESLSDRQGFALVEYPDGGPMLLFKVNGSPNVPEIEPVDDFEVTDPIQPGSPRVEGDGPYTLEIGRCGLRHGIDFDGSFWVLVGDVDAEHQAVGGAETGSIVLFGQDRARYLGSLQTLFELVRFPGARRFEPCG